MTEKITREEIEGRLEQARSGLAEHEKYTDHVNGELRTTSKAFVKHFQKEIALCTLALQAEAMQPRPNALVIQEHGAWVAMLLDKDIMAQGPTADIAMERLHEVVSIEAEDADHFEALKPNPVAKLFHVSLPEPRR